MRAAGIVVAIWLASLGAAAQFGKFAVLFDRIAAQYPEQPLPLIGLLISAVGFVGLVFGTTGGLIVSGLGYRRVMVTALMAGAAISATEAMAPPLPVMLALRLIEGLSHLAIVVAAPVLTAILAQGRWQAAAMSLYSSFFAVSFAALGVLGPRLAAWHGIEAVLVFHAVYMALAAGLMALLLPKDGPRWMPVLSLRGLALDHVAIYSSPCQAAPAMGFVCYTMTYVAFLTVMPQLFAGQPQQAMLATFMPLVSVAVSLTLGVWALSRVSAVRVVQLGFGAAILASAGLWLAWPVPSAVVLAAFAVAASLGIVQSASFAAIPQLNAEPQARAQAAGAIAQLGNLGTTSGTPILVWLFAAKGISGLALFLALFSALGIALHAWQERRRQTRST